MRVWLATSSRLEALRLARPPQLLADRDEALALGLAVLNIRHQSAIPLLVAPVSAARLLRVNRMRRTADGLRPSARRAFPPSGRARRGNRPAASPAGGPCARGAAPASSERIIALIGPTATGVIDRRRMPMPISAIASSVRPPISPQTPTGTSYLSAASHDRGAGSAGLPATASRSARRGADWSGRRRTGTG